MNQRVPIGALEHGRDRGIDAKSLVADLAMIATFAAVIALFVVSPITLESRGIGYLSSGGGIVSKFHPATLIALVALGLRCLAAERPMATGWRLATDDVGCVLLFGTTALAGVIATAFAKTPVTPLVDTFILPILLFILLRDLDSKLTRWLAIIIGVVLTANAIIGIIEVSTGWRAIAIDIPEGVSTDPTRMDMVFSWQAQFLQEWRATALLGHPLVNGLVVGAFILCLLAPGSRWIPAWVSVPLAGLEFASMFAFGARAALVSTVVCGAILLVQRTVAALDRGRRLRPEVVALGLVVAAVAIAGIDILYEHNFFDRMIERFTHDQGSAESRLTMFELVGSIPWTDLLLGPDQARVATLQSQLGLEFGIESSWIGLTLTYGLLVTMMIMIGLAALARSVVRSCGGGATTVVAFYIVLVSVAEALSTKSTTLAMLVCLLLLFIPGEDRPRRSASHRPVALDPNPWH